MVGLVGLVSVDGMRLIAYGSRKVALQQRGHCSSCPKDAWAASSACCERNEPGGVAGKTKAVEDYQGGDIWKPSGSLCTVFQGCGRPQQPPRWAVSSGYLGTYLQSRRTGRPLLLCCFDWASNQPFGTCHTGSRRPTATLTLSCPGAFQVSLSSRHCN